MKLRLSARAEDDLAAIADYIGLHAPRASTKVQTELVASLRLIAEHPLIGRHVGRGLRRLVVPRLPYVIIYRVDTRDEAVSVATIRHSSRRPIV